jgi:hypothetical protein
MKGDSKMDDVIRQVIADVRPYTMVPDEGLSCTIELTLKAINDGVPGDLVECGTWKGGSSFAMLLAQRYAYGEIKRPVWMYDSFEGMSPPSPEDGNDAHQWHERSLTGVVDPKGQNFCKAPLDQVWAAIDHFEFGNKAIVRKGWLHESLPIQKPEAIAVLRIDCDWYDPVMCVYRELEPLVSVGAPIIIDDYVRWDGCVLATHEYLARNSLPWRIRSVPNNAGAWMIKQPATS